MITCKFRLDAPGYFVCTVEYVSKKTNKVHSKPHGIRGKHGELEMPLALSCYNTAEKASVC